MEITERQAGSATVLALSGDIDLETSPALRAALKEKAAQAKASPQGPSARLVLDFAAVTYIDSSGLATLIEYFQTTRGSGGKLALAAVAPRVRGAFELVRLDEIFPLHPGVDEALAAVAKD
jgi:anti-sigma B factor antagonist